MTGPTDERRLLALLRGDRAERDRGLRELFDAHHRSLYGLALRMTGRADLADDAVQETFVDLLRGLDGFRGEARLTTWMYRIAVRAATRVAARAGRGGVELAAEPADAAADPAAAAADRDGAERILAAITALPAPQRAVVALSALRDLHRAEIAAVLGIPEGTVDSRLHAARARLREVLERGRS